MEEVVDLSVQRFGQMTRAFERVAGQIDDSIGFGAENQAAERPGLFFRRSIGCELLDFRPGRVTAVRAALRPADIHDGVTGFDQPWDQICPDMASAADD
jgi:hypothetical protein